MNFRKIIVRVSDLLLEQRFTRESHRAIRRVSSNFPWDNVASRAERAREREGEERRAVRAIVIKHRELAKLRCNLADDVLPHGLARREPRAAPTQT